MTTSTTMQERRKNRPRSMKWDAELLEIIDESPDVKTFRFDKPEGWTFIPGQYVMIFFPDRFGKKNRAYSIASSPNSEYLEFTIKLYGLFTHHMWTLKPGSVWTMRGPYGHYMLDQKRENDVMLISAGVGVTPNMSMMRWATEEKSDRRFLHVYSNKRPRDIVFHKELMTLERMNPNIKNIYTLTRLEDKLKGTWPGLNGRISAEMVVEALQEWQDQGAELPTVYSCGPERMNLMIRDTLMELGWPREEIHYEKFW
ncbi:MAG: ferredoxin--NADP reductase [Candidatus Kariarchaeaceae archaeon]